MTNFCKQDKKKIGNNTISGGSFKNRNEFIKIHVE